ncbi:MAG: hypothetical protein ACRBCL_14700 [Maritimibacter sp.]
MAEAHVILELPNAWLSNPADGDRHLRLYLSIWQSLADIGVTVRAVPLPFGADTAVRIAHPDQLVISFHSRGPAGNVLRIKESYVPPYYTIDRLGFSGFSELAKFPEKFAGQIDTLPTKAAMKFVTQLKTEIVQGNLSKYGQPSGAAKPPPGPYVFMPLQTVEDPVASLSDLDQMEALEALASATSEMGWNVIVKRHPLCESDHVARELARLEGKYTNLMRSTASVHPLISNAEAVIGANSGVLFEALVHGAHVITFAQSDFRSATTPIKNCSEIAGAILGRARVDRASQCRFLAWYLLHYCVRSDDVHKISTHIAAALFELDIHPSSDLDLQRELFEQSAATEAARRRSVLAKGRRRPFWKKPAK